MIVKQCCIRTVGEKVQRRCRRDQEQQPLPQMVVYKKAEHQQDPPVAPPLDRIAYHGRRSAVRRTVHRRLYCALGRIMIRAAVMRRSRRCGCLRRYPQARCSFYSSFCVFRVVSRILSRRSSRIYPGTKRPRQQRSC